MNDAIALLAVSQLVCLGAIGYLYMEVQKLRRQPRRSAAPRPQHPREAVKQAARQAYAASPRAASSAFGRDAGSIAARMNELGIDVPALARRMNRSEEEVRLLLRRQGVLH
jgi:hypothetical protein